MDNNNLNIDELVNQIQLEVDNLQPVEETAIEVVPEIVPDLTQDKLSLFDHTQIGIELFAYNSQGVLKPVEGYHLVNRIEKDIPEWSNKQEYDINGDTILDVQKNSVSIISSEQMESVAEQLVQLGYSVYSSGELKNGKLMYIELEHEDLPTLEIPGTQLVPKIWIGTSHDGTLAFKSTKKVIDTFCMNTFMMNSRSFSLFTAKHTKNAEIKIKNHEQALQDAQQGFKQYYEAVEMLAETPVHNPEPYFASVLNAKKEPRKVTINGISTMSEPRYSGRHVNQLQQLMDSWNYGAGQAERGNNMWRAFSAVTDWADNNEGNAKDREKDNHIIGTRANQKNKAFDIALAVANR